MSTIARNILRFSFAAVIVLTAACTPSSEKQTLHDSRFSKLKGWESEDHAEALEAFKVSCVSMLKKKSKSVVGEGRLAGPASAWQALCRKADELLPVAAKSFFETHFVPMSIQAGGDPEGLFTGYYEPVIKASTVRTKQFSVPIYARPKDLKDGEPYLTRAEIENGGLKKRGKVLYWAADPVQLFFLQVQGSGRVQLTDGTERRVGFAGKNNQPYTAIGKVLVDRGELPSGKANLFSIRQWLYANPTKARELMQKNESYVFFKNLGGAAPIGAQGVPLTPQRSLAVDPRFIPYGMPVYVETTLPKTKYNARRSFNRLMIAQDTGTAIKGAVRGDIFFGAGLEAEALAGMMQSSGKYTVLVPKTIAATLKD